MKQSELETDFLTLWTRYGPGGPGSDPERQYKWHPERNFRADFAWPKQLVLVEMQGFGRGHMGIQQFSADRFRSNEATRLGWRVLEFTRIHLRESPLQVIEQIVDVMNQPSRRH